MDKDRFEFFKHKMEELGGSLTTLPVSRLSKEYSMRSTPLNQYDIEFKSPLHWILTSGPTLNQSIKIDIQISENYPFQPPRIQILDPYYLAIDPSVLGWGTISKIGDVIGKIHILKDSILSRTEASLDSNTRQSIQSAKESEDPLYLIMGSNPTENRRGRTFYDDTQYYMLDYLDIPIESNRYFHIDFNDVNTFMYLAMQLPNRFQTICFDWATMKFFTGESTESLYLRIMSLKNVLKEDGRIYFESGLHGTRQVKAVPGNRPGEYKFETVPPKIDKEVFISICTSIGLHITERTMQFTDDPVLQEVYGKRTEPPLGSEQIFLVASKAPLRGGQRTKRKTKRRYRRRASRKRI
jgi:hypothetical protein